MESKKNGFIENYFKLTENNTDVRTEVIAGITTFLAMSYILAVNPLILARLCKILCMSILLVKVQ